MKIALYEDEDSQDSILASRTMPSHFAEFISKNTSPGVVIASKRLGIAVVVELNLSGRIIH